MTKGVKITLAVTAALVGLTFTCCFGTLVLGLVGGEETTPAAGMRTSGGAGFTFAPPSSFQKVGEDRWRREQRDDTEVYWVEVRRLPPLAGLEGAEEKLSAQWRKLLSGAYEQVHAPLVQRRFVSNGARAYFGRARLLRPGNPEPVMVSLYLVEADERLEPFLVVQGCDTTAMGSQMIISFSFPKTHAFVEELLATVQGSPTGGPLVSDDEVTGHFVFGDTNTAQWINTVTGATSMTAVARAVDFTFNDDHTYTYAFTGGSGQVGAIQFATDKDQGRWKVEHDLLVLTGEKYAHRYFITGAPRGPDGQQVLLLQSEPTWSFSPNVESEVYVRK
ncbi:hypothetical protein [Hyalangium rubrum]|uniref:Lipoprotein n=1 Tax=Hyalangium rubrum TaxID=3103134 RepID=A0ABU5H909_9BACT|nr:hypothetical protein [Hyalangium sp. s54d21]MDY7229612.1 hypothetical protein [Hyalangium sp. s54d21]